MRVKTRYNPIVACSLILLFAIFIFCFALTLPAASADATVYLEADVTVGGDFLPSVLTYTGSDYSFGFNLYKSEDRSTWENDADVDHLSNFSLKFYDLEDNLLPFAPTVVGTYYVRVVANDVLFGYKNNDAEPRVIAGNVVVGEKRFSIAYQTISLFCTPLDGADSLVLDDTHSDYYPAVTSGASLYLAGSPLTLTADYTLTVQY